MAATHHGRQAVAYLLTVTAVAVVLIGPEVWGYFTHGRFHAANPIPYLVLNGAAAAIIAPLLLWVDRHCRVCAMLAFGLLLLVNLFAGFVQVELYSRFGFSFSPRFFANVSAEAARIGLLDLDWRLPIGIAVSGLSVVVALWFIMRSNASRQFHGRAVLLPLVAAFMAATLLLAKWESHSQRAVPILGLGTEAYRYYLAKPPRIELQWTAEELDIAESLGMSLTDPEIGSQDNRLVHHANVLLVYLEGFNAEYVVPGLDGFPDLTPHLSRIARRSIVVPEFYNSVDDTVNAVVSGLCGVMTGYADSDWRNGRVLGLGPDVPCITDILHDVGYQVAFTWGDSREFSGMDQLLSQHAVDTFHDRTTIRQRNPQSMVSNHGNIYDIDLVDFAIEQLDELAQEPPFFLTLVTYDTHFQFETAPGCPPYTWHPDAVSWNANTQPGSRGSNEWLRAVHCADHAIGRLWNHLEETGRLDDTVVVFVGDHMSWRDIARHGTVLMMIHSPFLDMPAVLPIAGHTPDLAPTLLALAGLPVDAMHFGRSLFGSRADYQHLVAPNFDVRDGRMSSVTLGGTAAIATQCDMESLLNTVLTDANRHLTACERTKLLSKQWVLLDGL